MRAAFRNGLRNGLRASIAPLREDLVVGWIAARKASDRFAHAAYDLIVEGESYCDPSASPG